MEDANDVPALPSATEPLPGAELSLPSAAKPLPGAGISLPSAAAPLSGATSPSFNWLAFITEQKALGRLMDLQDKELKAYVLQ